MLKWRIMKIIQKKIDGASLISVSGRIDSISSNDLETTLNKVIDESSRIILDLADTEYMSSSGFRVLLACQKALKAKHGDLILVSLQPVVRDVLEITGLARLFSIQKSLDDAFCSLKAG